MGVLKSDLKYDKWQEEILAEKGNILLAKGRRIGATHIMGVKAVEHLKNNFNSHPKSQIVCVSATLDQAELIIAFATLYARWKYPKLIGKKADRPTLTKLVLVVDGNRRILLARPVGDKGTSTRGFEAQILMVDEAPQMGRLFWVSAKPILATQGGKIWMWGTFDGQDEEDYFWARFDEVWNKGKKNARFKVFHKDTEDIANNRPISRTWTKEQRKDMIQYLKDEKEDMSEQEYLQEYMGIAASDIKRLYREDLITELTTGKPQNLVSGKNYLGVDIARLGDDKSSFQVVNERKDKYIHIHQTLTRKTLTTETEDMVVMVAEEHKCKKIGLDAGAGTLGVSVLDHLLLTKVKHKLIALNNRQIVLDKGDNPKKQRLLKEDMHLTLLSLMEHKKIILLDDDDLRASLRSFRYEYVRKDDGTSKMRITARNNDPVEGLIRAVHLAVKEKSLNLFATSSNSDKYGI